LPRLTKFYRTLFELGSINDKEPTVVGAASEDLAYAHRERSRCSVSAR
jgi:hypothetical protein